MVQLSARYNLTMKLSKIALIGVGLIVLIIFAWLIKFYVNGRTIQKDISNQMNVLILPSEKEVYSVQHNRRCFLASYETPIIDTYCQWVGIRFYEFNEQSVDKGVGQLQALLAREGYEQHEFINRFPSSATEGFQIFNGSSVSGEYRSQSLHPKVNTLELTCFKPRATMHASNFFYIGNSPISTELSFELEPKISKAEGIVICGYLIEAGNFIFQ